jgi:uncharacterized protein
VPNRLAASTSPYLLQHQDNPVDWWEWGPEAFAEAERRDVPVLLSIGYAACHWCHVMAHESFEDEATAAYMNAHFVNVKVDREERPDVDAVYMEAVQAMTGHGGWPMTSFLTTKGEPFFCGTYWPPEPRHGMPAFTEVLQSVVQAWEARRGEVDAAGREVVERLSRPVEERRDEVTPELLDKAAAALARSYDGVHGGFGSAPKFPPSMLLEFLLRRHSRTGEGLEKVAHTCEAMARGGMYDQLAGGFARYSVDERWVVPHFEKMLYDNALLLRVYAHWWRSSGSAFARRVCVETAEFLLRDLGTAEGGFASALDADAAGVEGSTYVWTPAQLAEVLGQADGAWAAEQLEVTAEGTFEHGASSNRARTLSYRGTRASARGCSRRVRAAPSLAVTTRWSRPGTGSPSPRWRRRACSSTSRGTCRRPSTRPLSSSGSTGWRAGCSGSPGTAWPGAMPGCWRTTPT